MKLPRFFEQGVQFECQGSGKCCVSHGEFGYVYLDPADRKRMAKYLNLSLNEFMLKYTQNVDGFVALKDNPDGGDCLFLKDRKCTIYEGRPTQCRTWPFWPEVMNARSWKKNVEAFCPGVGKGRTFTKSEIEEKLAQQILSEQSMRD